MMSTKRCPVHEIRFNLATTSECPLCAADRRAELDSKETEQYRTAPRRNFGMKKPGDPNIAGTFEIKA